MKIHDVIFPQIFFAVKEFIFKFETNFVRTYVHKYYLRSDLNSPHGIKRWV